MSLTPRICLLNNDKSIALNLPVEINPLSNFTTINLMNYATLLLTTIQRLSFEIGLDSCIEI